MARPSALDRTDVWILAGLLLAFALIRGAVFPIAENLYGDAVVRSEIAERWAEQPKLLRSFDDGIFQFGPLHFYLTGAALWAWPAREHAPRLVSLLVALATILPVYRLGKRLFSRRAAIATTSAMAVWGLHIQASTTAASEALFLCLFFWALDRLVEGLEENRFGPLLVSALFVNLFCATRYDGWMYAPLFALTAAGWGSDRIAAITKAVIYGMLLCAFPLWWMQQSEKATGDALYALHYINQFHANWVKDGIGWLGETKHRLMSLFFWPGTVLATASLPVGLFALAGMVRDLVQKKRRALALLAILPAGYYAFRGAVLLDFSPLARFFMVQVALALFYVEDGFEWLLGRAPIWLRRGMAGLTAAAAVGTTVFLGQLTAFKSGVWQDSLRPISPISTIPLDQKAAADFLKQHVQAGESVIVDEAPQYVDINVAFFSGIAEKRLARRRWENFDKQLGEAPSARWLFASKSGALQLKDGLAVGEQAVSFRGRSFELAAKPSDQLFIYRER